MGIGEACLWAFAAVGWGLMIVCWVALKQMSRQR